MPATTPLAARRRWLGVLARASTAELEAALAQLPAALRDPAGHELLRAPEAGLLMLRGRAGGEGEPFPLGEASVCRCTVRLASGVLGTGYTLGRDRRKAHLIAWLDALLQVEPARAAPVVEPLAAKQAERADAAGRATAASRVEFFTLVRD